MVEPKRINTLAGLDGDFKFKLVQLIGRMQDRGFSPVLFETLRTKERQRWLYGKGRTKWQLIRKGINPIYAQPKDRQVTWTLKSRHLDGKGADVIEQGKGWSNALFFDVLHAEAEHVGLKSLHGDRCHVELSSVSSAPIKIDAKTAGALGDWD